MGSKQPMKKYGIRSLMASELPASALGSAPSRRAARAPARLVASWPLIDRVAYLLCWAVGIGLCVVGAWIVLYMLVKGVAYLSPRLLLHVPGVGPTRRTSGGFLDPIEGTLLMARARHRCSRRRWGWRWRCG